MTQAKDIVRELAEEKGALLVSFQNHQGCFEVPAGDKSAREALVRSRDFREEITFTFNAQAKITVIGGPPAPGNTLPGFSAPPPKNG